MATLVPSGLKAAGGGRPTRVLQGRGERLAGGSVYDKYLKLLVVSFILHLQMAALTIFTQTLQARFFLAGFYVQESWAEP